MRRHHKNADVAIKASPDEEILQTGTSPGRAAKWKCLACGAFNDDSDQVCSECTAAREVEPAFERAEAAGSSDWESPSDGQVAAEPEEQISEPAIASSIEAPSPSTFIPSPSWTPSSAQSQATGTGQYYLLFVNSPAPSMINVKVPLHLENFSTISIGRNSENVVVIPDQEVSRKHAELTMKGNKIMIRDLNSKNGTFLYNGKTFEKVSDSAEVKPNSLLKFGTGTTVRLTIG